MPRTIRLAALIVACLSSRAAAQPSVMPDPVRRDTGYYPYAKAYIHIPAIPKPISPPELRRWSWMLSASDEQMQVMYRLYDQYVGAEQALHNRLIQPLWDRSAELRSQFAVQPAPMPVAIEFAKLIDDARSKAVDALVTNEDLFFDQVGQFISDVQQPLLIRVRADRARTRSARQDSWHPGSRLDASLLLWTLHEGGYDLNPSDPILFAGVLDRYDAESTAVFALLSRADIESTSKTMLIQSQSAAGMGSQQELGAEQRRMRSSLVQLEARLHGVNARFIDAARPLLPPTTGKRLLELFNEAVFQPVFPDPTDLTAWFDAVRTVDGLSDVVRAEVERIEAQVGTQRDGLCRLMCEAFIDYRMDLGSMRGDRFDEYSEMAASLHAQRMAIASAAVSRTLALLNPAQADALRVATDSAQSRLNTRFIADRSRGR